jgi:hypothetical protein
MVPNIAERKTHQRLQEFCSTPQKDFCNNIGANRTFVVTRISQEGGWQTFSIALSYVRLRWTPTAQLRSYVIFTSTPWHPNQTNSV